MNVVKSNKCIECGGEIVEIKEEDIFLGDDIPCDYMCSICGVLYDYSSVT